MVVENAPPSVTAPTVETYQDSYKNYADYNGVLRTWFLSFGLGALVLFMLHPEFVNSLRERNHFVGIVLLFLAGCFGQIFVALVNKVSSWHVYDAAKKGVPPGRLTEFFYNAFWIDKWIDACTALAFIVAIGFMVSDFVFTTKPTPINQPAISPGDFALETSCSDASAKLFQRANVEPQSLASYRNHWNKKLGKCFIRIDAPGKDNFLSIEVYDALENRRYASFAGHQFCEGATVAEHACEFDSATVWMDGNDDRVHGDYNVGFNGVGHGGIGSTQTRTEFLEHIRGFMTD